MKKALIFCFVLVFSNTIFGQQMNPVSWESSVEKINDWEYNLLFTATIQPGWHLYNLKIPKGGPIATSFIFEKDKAVKIEGEVFTKFTPVKAYDNSFSMELEYFSNMVVFKQKVRTNKGKSNKVKGYIRYMSCDDKQCIPPAEHNFELLIE